MRVGRRTRVRGRAGRLRSRPMVIDPHAPLRIGVVGAGRARQGTGPYLAAAAEEAGAFVAAVAGRDRAGAERAAAGLAAARGHAVAAAADLGELAAGVDAVIVASPAEAHAAGLAAALGRSRPCLCEKPLLPFARRDAAAGLIAAFAAHDVLLVEHCQWPEVLPAFFALYPGRAGCPPAEVVMGMSPAGVGRAMIEDSLSHVLSLVQALAAVDASAGVRDVRQRDTGSAAEHNVLTFTLQAMHGPVRVELRLDRCQQQPRPAWFAVDGARVDRRIGAGYAMSLVAGEREQPLPDPLRALVTRFVAWCREDDPNARRRAADAIRARAELGAAIVG